MPAAIANGFLKTRDNTDHLCYLSHDNMGDAATMQYLKILTEQEAGFIIHNNKSGCDTLPCFL